MKTSQEPLPKKRKTKKKVKTQSEGCSSDVQTLSHYVSGSDRTVLLEQLFLAVDEETIQSLLLPTLQGKSLEELKELCKTQLTKLSDQEIISVFAAVSQRGSVCTLQPMDPLDIDDHTRTRHHHPQEDSDSKAVEKEKIIKAHEELPDVPVDAALQLCPDQSEMEIFENVEKEVPQTSRDAACEPVDDTTGESWVECKTEREIMELEFRARAIRSLMRSQGLASAHVDEEADADGDIQRQVREALARHNKLLP